MRPRQEAPIRTIPAFLFRTANRVLRGVSLELQRIKPPGALPAPLDDGDAPARTLGISVEMMSRMFWERVLGENEYWARQRREDLFARLARLDTLQRQAEFATGSITASTAWCLYCLARYFAPGTALEVGTFIGRSTTAIALGMLDAGVAGGRIHTCDGSNSMALPPIDGIELRQYPLTMSTTMLGSLAGSGAGFAHIDGRIGDKDVGLAAGALARDAVIALDDFEGIEKGVANYARIRASAAWNTHTLIYPCSDAILARAGLGERSTTAVLLPKRMIRLTDQ